ncbi:MAG: PEP/pyruvate-binding domain-containing protein [Pseudomonadota bacterium]
MPLVPLQDAASLGRRRAGGKAMGLARLLEHGLPVPPGFVIPVEVFRAFLKGAGLWKSALKLARTPDPVRARALKGAILAASLPPALAAELRSAAGALGPALGVRSSAVEEDASDHSWAGVFHTELGVAPGDALERAVLTCWASAFEERALAYGRRGRPPGMALVVQRLIPARAAGVVFSINALTGSWRQMTVEAVWGLGEALVGGHVVPDHALVRRPRRLPEPLQRVAARVRLEVLEESRQPQERELVPGPGGVAWAEVPAHRRAAPKLQREQVLRLCRLALRAEALSGCPQDVEWALDGAGVLWLLQARPITTPAEPPREARTLWTRRFIGERWSEPATPLGWSLVRPLLEHFIAYPRTTRALLGGEPALRLFEGAPYINATVFRHLAFKLPGLPPPRFMMDMLPPEEERAWMRRFAARPGVRVYAAILQETLDERRWERFRWNPFTNHLAWDALQRRLEEEVPARVAPPPGDTDPVRALARAEAGMTLARDYVKVHVTSLLFANLWYQVVEGLLAAWLGAEGERLAPVALRCPEENLTIATHHDLWALARRARALGEDLTTPPDPTSPFGRALSAFMAEHGHRSDASWEIMSPRWADQPERVLALMRRTLEASDEDPRARASAQSAEAEAALQALRSHATGPVQRAAIARLVALTRAYLLLRENQRYHFDRLLWAVQRNCLVIGAWAAARGALPRAEDVRFLEADEVRALVEGRLDPATARAEAATRAARYVAQRSRTPPDFLVADHALAEEAQGSRLSGLGTSPGIARGPARVLRDLSEAERLRPGEILVTRAVDPGWTPLFPVAAGLVLELGSQLSHGAVVAREYRLPMVVNVRGATQRLRTGQELTVDGRRGLVWVHD